MEGRTSSGAALIGGRGWAYSGDIVGETPSLDETREPLPRFYPEAINRGTTGTIEAMSLWAGESVGSVTRVQQAAEIVRELAEDAERLLRRWSVADSPRPV